MSQVTNRPSLPNTVSAKSLADCQAHLLSVICSQRFLDSEGLNNEVPFHICPFEPDISLDMSHAIKQLKNELADKNVSVLDINLYDLVIEILKEEGDLEWIMENEITLSRDELKEELEGILDIENVLIPAIASKMKAASYNVIFITGVGEVFPYMRSHNILNNLQRVAKDQPTLMFFPGKYDGHSLRLFNTLKEDHYYRAFRLIPETV